MKRDLLNIIEAKTCTIKETFLNVQCSQDTTFKNTKSISKQIIMLELKFTC